MVQREGCLCIRLADRHEADLAIVARIAIGHGDVDASAAQRSQTMDQQPLPDPLPLLIGRHGDGGKNEHDPLVLLVIPFPC